MRIGGVLWDGGQLSAGSAGLHRHDHLRATAAPPYCCHGDPCL